jgi:regulator of replication initiation timing
VGGKRRVAALGSDESSDPEHSPQAAGGPQTMISPEPTPANGGGNTLIARERTLGREAKELSKRYDQQIERHKAVVAEIHLTIIEFGQRVSLLRNLYSGDREFGEACVRYGLTEGRLGDQRERNAAMLIARLTDEGVDPLGLEQDNVQDSDMVKLVLDGCNDTVPTGIMKWARKNQSELFPALRERRARERARQKMRKRDMGERVEIVDDEVLIEGVNDIGTSVEELRAVNDALVEENAELRAENARLRQRVAELEAELAEHKVVGTELASGAKIADLGKLAEMFSEARRKSSGKRRGRPPGSKNKPKPIDGGTP